MTIETPAPARIPRGGGLFVSAFSGCAFFLHYILTLFGVCATITPVVFYSIFGGIFRE